MEIKFKIDFEYNGIFTAEVDGLIFDERGAYTKELKGEKWIEANMLDLKMEGTTEKSLIDLLENFEAVEAKEGSEEALKRLKKTKDSLFLTDEVSEAWAKLLDDYLENFFYEKGFVGTYEIKEAILIDYEVKDISIEWDFDRVDLPTHFEKLLKEKHIGKYIHTNGNKY